MMEFFIFLGAFITYYRVPQQKPDTKNFTSKKTLKNKLKTINLFILKCSFFNFVLVKRQLSLKYE